MFQEKKENFRKSAIDPRTKLHVVTNINTAFWIRATLLNGLCRFLNLFVFESFEPFMSESQRKPKADAIKKISWLVIFREMIADCDGNNTKSVG